MNQLQTQMQSGHEELNLVKMPKQSNQNITFANQGSDLNQLQSKINSRSEEFKNNQATMLNLVQDLKQISQKIALGGGESARQKHSARGKLLARDRIDQLIDAGTAFLEIGQLAAHKVYPDDVPAAGVVAGIGQVNGITCMIVANDATV